MYCICSEVSAAALTLLIIFISLILISIPFFLCANKIVVFYLNLLTRFVDKSHLFNNVLSSKLERCFFTTLLVAHVVLLVCGAILFNLWLLDFFFKEYVYICCGKVCLCISLF